MFTKIFRKRKLWSTFLILIAFISLIGSGFIELINFTQRKQRDIFFTQQDVNFAQQTRNLTDKDSNFLTGASASRLSILLGRQIIMGTLFSAQNSGFDIADRPENIRHVYQTTSIDQLKPILRQYDVDYLVIGDEERDYYLVNSEFYNQHFPVLLSNDSTTIYDVQEVF